MSKHLTSLSFLPILFFFFFLIFCHPSYGRFIPQCSTYFSLSSNLVSDGVQHLHGQPYLALNRSVSSFSAESTCDQTYGFLPCTTTVLGNIFLIVVYGYLMFLSATFLSIGSELLLEILGPSIVGGLLLPILGALPDAMLILESGVSTDIWTSYTARMLVISVIPFAIVQMLQVVSSTSGRHLAVLIALIVSLLLLISYCLYQVLQPSIQTRKISYVMHKRVIFGLLRHLRDRRVGRLLTDNGEPDEEGIKKLFSVVDENGDGKISHRELRALIVGIRFEEIEQKNDEAVDKLMRDFDTSHDSFIDETEFVEGTSKWLKKATRIRTDSGDSGARSRTPKFLNAFHQDIAREHDLLDAYDESIKGFEDAGGSRWTSIKAVLLLSVGTLIAVAFADPLVDAVNNFADATTIPSFFVSFIALPLATNSREAVLTIIHVRCKKRKTASLSFYELYGVVTIKNILNLSVFLALVYIRGLTWDFSSQVLVTVIVCLIVGGFASYRTHFPLWKALVAFLLYPFSLALIYVLNYVLGWS